MPLEVNILDSAIGTIAKVTKSGELVVGPTSYDDTIHKKLDTDNTAFNFFLPKIDKQFVIKGIIAQADKDVSNVATADIIIYEASSAGTTTVDKILLNINLTRFGNFPGLPLNLLVEEGKFVNAKTDDNSVFMTIMGYYISKL